VYSRVVPGSGGLSPTTRTRSFSMICWSSVENLGAGNGAEESLFEVKYYKELSLTVSLEILWLIVDLSDKCCQ